MQRSIAHIDLDSFFVSVERIKNPALIGKPVVVGGKGPRGVVCSASYEARRFGVHSAMPGAMAERLCKEAIFVWSDPAEYQNFSRQVTQIIQQEVPVVEKASIDEFYLDMSGMEKFYHGYKHLLHIRQRIIAETGLPNSVALATSKLVSKIATNEAKPNGEIEIVAGTELAWLAPLPVKKMPGVGPHAVEVLKNAGINTLGEVVAAGEHTLQQLLGKWGTDLHRRAQGIDDGEVTPYHEAKSISAEETFEEDTSDVNFLQNELARLVQKVGAQLRRDEKLTGCIAIKLRNSKFETITRQHIISYTSADHVMVKAAKSLLEQCYKGHEKLRLIGVRLSQLERDGIQLNLFNETAGEGSLYNTIDEIRKSFGKQAVVSAAALSSIQHRANKQQLWIVKNGNAAD